MIMKKTESVERLACWSVRLAVIRWWVSGGAGRTTLTNRIEMYGRGVPRGSITDVVVTAFATSDIGWFITVTTLGDANGPYTKKNKCNSFITTGIRELLTSFYVAPLKVSRIYLLTLLYIVTFYYFIKVLYYFFLTKHSIGWEVSKMDLLKFCNIKLFGCWLGGLFCYLLGHGGEIQIHSFKNYETL